MKLMIVQLSDIHLSTERWPVNPIMNRVARIESAIKRLFLDDISECLLLVNGDIAYSGLPAEYDMGAKLLSEVRDALHVIFTQEKCHTVLLPGNHDCDFNKDTAARKNLIDDVHPDAFDDGSILDICTKPQQEFFSFYSAFQNQSIASSGIPRILDVHKFEVGTEVITVRVLNTAWGSRINETLGSLPMPIKPLKPLLLGDADGSVVITAFHHPYSWLHRDVSREIRSIIEETSDLVFTGHEHERQSYSKTKFTGEHNEYIEAGPLQENAAPDQSEFNIVLVDTTKQEYVVHHFAWDGEMYELVNETTGRPFIRNNSRLRSEFALNARFEEELNDTDTEYHHPFKDVVKLDDIFIYPDLREFSFMGTGQTASAHGGKGPDSNSRRNQGGKPNENKADQFFRSTVRSREIVDYVLRKKHVVVSAPERGGRTAFSRILFRDLWQNGKVPIYLSCESWDPKTTSNFPKFLDQLFARQYRSPKVSRYWDIDADQRAVILDDFHKLPNVRVMREKLLTELQKRFSIIVIVGGASLRFQELLASGEEANLLSDFVHTEFLSFGHKLRSQLIRRWFELGRQDMLPDDQVARQVATLEKIISIVLGRDLLPPFPSYILLLLQEMELRQPVDIAAASYGKLYRASMTSSLAKKGFDVETVLSYLSALAYAFFSAKTDSFDDQQAIGWHNRYVDEYKITLEFEGSRDGLVSAGLLSYHNGTLRFKVKAAFYFFLANYLSSHKEEAACQHDIKTLASKLYREDAANVILFLCHLDPTPLVIDEMLANARKIFESQKETDLTTDVAFTGDLVARLQQPVIESGDPEKRRQRKLEAQDALVEDDDPSDDMYQYKREDETDLDSEARRYLAQINAAFKTIQIQGQIVRSFAGSLKGDRKRQLVESCYALSLRLLNFTFDALKMTKDDFGRHIAKRIAQKHPDFLPDRVTAIANALVFMLVEMCTLAVIRHVANSVGTERLAPILKEIVDERNTFSIRTLNGAIQIEHFRNIPEKLLIDLYEEAESNLLMQSVIKHLAFDRMTYFHCPHDVQQRLCSKLGIKVIKAVVLDKDRKRH